MSFTFHLARRGMDTAHQVMSKPEQGDGEEIQVSPIAALIFTITVLAFFVLTFAVSYTYGHLIPTLCMVESPETTAYVPVEVIEPSEPPAYSATPKPPGSEDEDGSDPELLLVQNKPITSSLRQTILHLRARAGYWSRFRGLSLYIVLGIVSGLLASSLAAIFQSHLGVAFAVIVAEVILSRWIMTWIHIVISEPSERRWYQRVPPWNTWKKMAPAVALWALSNQIVRIMPMLVCGSFGSLKHMKNPEYQPGHKDLYAVGAQGFMGMLLMVALFIGLEIPATVSMVRVAASMLPEEDETIIPFDRSFGGKTTPTIVGGQGKIGILEAWKTFPFASRVRLLKLVGKVAIIFVAIWSMFIIVAVLEAQLLFGDKMGDFMKTIHHVAGPK